ncbi:MAG: 3-dehydroquinate synthase [Gammaproteobacteria bacterium]|nr:3-dehydroquinate synthase [Gammaproteobacteria bacterium]
MKTLKLDLGSRSYPIHIGSGLLAKPDLLTPHIVGTRIALVSNETVAPIYMEQLATALSQYQPLSIVLPDGEQHKTLEVLDRIFTALLSERCDRQTTLIALGGGVVGDMTGFAAACYQRGVPFIQAPTTLLAQVDASVGGKTGVNHRLGKNMVGAFYQPQCVVIDTDTLSTLPDNELSAGIAEVVKYGLIRDPEFFDWLENNLDKLLDRDEQALSFAIYQSCENKAEVVSADEREADERALLNLGHTFGHAIEAGLGYGTWLHGEAVAAGMAMAADLSQRLGWLGGRDVERIKSLLSRAQLPIRVPASINATQFLDLMSVDKKTQGGRLRLVLLEAIGRALVTDDFESEYLMQTLRACRSEQ